MSKGLIIGIVGVVVLGGVGAILYFTVFKKGDRSKYKQDVLDLMTGDTQASKDSMAAIMDKMSDQELKNNFCHERKQGEH
jgi:hypothetical protein